MPKELMESNSEDESMLDIGFMYDACMEKTTCKFRFGDRVCVELTCAEAEPGALQSGHYVWPAAPSLCKYLEENDTLIPKGNIVELGAGCGLTGLAVAQLRPNATVVFTDHDPGVLKIIEHNLTQQKQKQAECFTQCLRWGSSGENEIQQIEALTPRDSAANGALYGTRNTDLIIGTDVIYAQEVVPLLFWTVDRLLKRPGGLFVMCSSFSYGSEVEQEIDAQCAKYSLAREIISCDLANKGTRIQHFRVI